MSDNLGSRFDWTDGHGVRHHWELPVTATNHHILTWESHDELPWAAIAGAILVGLLAGIGAILEWRAAARAWKRPGPRRGPVAAAPSALATTGGAS